MKPETKRNLILWLSESFWALLTAMIISAGILFANALLTN